MKNENKKEYFKYSEVEEKEVEYLWYPYIPKGMVSILQGDPKCGKTFMLIDIISRITRGDNQPLSDLKFKEGSVILQNNDDPINYTLVPRLNKQGANLEKVIFIDEEKKKLTFKDLSRLENTIKEEKPLLVVIDPIQAFMGGADSNSMVQVRETLSPLKRIAEENNCAIVLVQHLKKGSENKAIYKGAGSIDFVGFARSMLMVIRDEETENERLFLHTCSNVSKEGNCLSYRISENGLEWLQDKGNVNVDEVVNIDTNTKYENAKNFILGAIASKGEISASELNHLCEVGGFSERTFNGARSILNKNEKIYSTKKNNRTYWSITTLLDKVQSCNVESEVKNNG